ncbi:MAG: replication and repair protein RecF [Verrucomicrobiales bacterium]|nr:replication and repair protein RecF [Verrucomicrobiales bacterium]
MLHDLNLTNVRCFESLALRLAPGFNFFLGPNGEGKTSVLEAACILLRLQSQRSSSLAPAIKLGAKSLAITGGYDGHLLEFRYGGLRRKLQLDGTEQRSATEYLRLARVVSFANTDIEMVRGSSEARRRYLDFIGVQVDPRYRPTLRAYERALRSRNALLKSAPPRLRELAAYNLPLVEHGAILGKMRANIVVELAPFVAAAHAEISDSKENADIVFSSGNEENYADHLARTREQETRLRQTIVGPHRDDLDLQVDGMEAQAYASEGQQRTLALALKIAQARLFQEYGPPPLLLIDDIFGELDQVRRRQLLGSLPRDSQKLVTSTTRQWDESLEGPVFELRNGEMFTPK